jgi:CRISPR/Cas system-associated protein endoribonuclease Cas2
MSASVTYLTLFPVTADKQANLRNSLLNGGLVLAQNSVALSTQRTYNSTWKKWIVIMQTCNHNPTAACINCTHSTHDQVLQLLLIFISYCVDTLGVDTYYKAML